MSFWQREAFAHLPKVTEVNLTQVIQIYNQLDDPPARVLLLVSWLHAARSGNVLRLTPANIEIGHDSEGPNWTIVWTKAKTCGKVGAYTTFSALTPEWLAILQEFMKAKAPSDPLFSQQEGSTAMDALRQALKMVSGKADVRALRRGSLCAMAEKGVPLDMLLVFSGHTTVHMLLRYLKRGKAVADRMTKGCAAARAALL